MGRSTSSVYAIVLFIIARCHGLDWEQVKCSSDTEVLVPEGRLSSDAMGRFPWIGVIQHGFYLGGKTRFAITSAVLVHPAFALAPAEDMAKIDRQTLTNNTHFIVWQSSGLKYSLDVVDYVLHPDFQEGTTFATLALVELLVGEGQTRSGHPAPVLPICLPMKGGGVFDNLYVVKMTDETGQLEKEVLKVDYVDNKDCDMFYEKAELSYKKMKPTYQICAVAQGPLQPCVWDGGAVLITRQTWGFWKLLGFGVRGPGCGAPTRFVDINTHLQWLDQRMSRAPFESLPDESLTFVLRTISPVEMHMYKAGEGAPEEEGQCQRKLRGQVIFKDATELTTNKNFVQGFYFVAVAQVADFACMVLKMHTQTRSNAAVWVEHHCHREETGLARPPQPQQLLCFLYFKTTAYVEFRFYFSFKTQMEFTMFGHENLPRAYFKPWSRFETTLNWYPTDGELLRWYNFVPKDVWWYWM